jgi:hypothetical protein
MQREPWIGNLEGFELGGVEGFELSVCRLSLRL